MERRKWGGEEGLTQYRYMPGKKRGEGRGLLVKKTRNVTHPRVSCDSCQDLDLRSHGKIGSAIKLILAPGKKE